MTSYQVGGLNRIPDADKGMALPEAVPTCMETHSPKGERWLMRDDGVIFGWNSRLAWDKRFTAIDTLPKNYVENVRNARVMRERAVVQFSAQRKASEDRQQALRKLAADRIRAARGLIDEIDQAAAEKAQIEAEERSIMRADAEGLAHIALEKWNLRLPLGDVALMRDAVVQLWDGTLDPATWAIGEPDWMSKANIATWMRDKFFVQVSSDIKLPEAKAQARALLDGYTSADRS